MFQNEKTCWYLWLATFVALLSYFQTGITTGWTSPILPVLQSPNSTIPTPPTAASWMATIVPFVSVFISPFAALSVNYLGLRLSLLIPSLLYLVSWIVISTAETFQVILIARSLNGIAMSFSYTATPIYLGEIAPNELRSKIGLLMAMVNSLGIFWIYAIGELMELWLSSLLSAVSIVLFLVLYWLLPESPYFLAKKGELEASRIILEKLRGHSVVEEMEGIRCSSERIRFKDSCMELLTKYHHLKALGICVGCLVLSQITGGTAFIFYSHTIFQNASSASPYTLSLVKSFCQLFSSLFASFIVERSGKKPLLIISCLGSTIFTLIQGIYFQIHDSGLYQTKSYWWIPLFSMIFFDMFQAIGITPISIAFLGEFFSPNVKSIGVCICKISLALSVFTVGFLFQFLVDEFGNSVPFYVFSVMGVLGLVFVIWAVPETRGRSFNEIQWFLMHGTYQDTQAIIKR